MVSVCSGRFGFIFYCLLVSYLFCSYMSPTTASALSEKDSFELEFSLPPTGMRSVSVYHSTDHVT